jgi:hypothetical protein
MYFLTLSYDLLFSHSSVCLVLPELSLSAVALGLLRALSDSQSGTPSVLCLYQRGLCTDAIYPTHTTTSDLVLSTQRVLCKQVDVSVGN